MLTNKVPIQHATSPKQALQKVLSVEFPDDEPQVKIKAYRKSELARMYGVSLATLINWINRHLSAFAEIGYQKNTKTLTPLEVKLLFEKIGEP